MVMFLKNRYTIYRTRLIIIFFILILSFLNPGFSSAEMKAFGGDIAISWSAVPPTWFRIFNNPVRPVPVWFDIDDMFPFECVVEQPVARLAREGIYTLIDGGIYDGFVTEKLFFLDELDLQTVWCDCDGLIDDGSHERWTSNTGMGCVWVKTHAEIIGVSGGFDVEIPVAARGGMYDDNAGNNFIRIYFPESITSSMQIYDSEIKLGCCREMNPDGYLTLGSIFLKNMRVHVYKGSWTDIWVHK